MQNLPETTTNVLVSALMGIIGGLITTPINALISAQLKNKELFYQHQLNMIAKKQELLLQHKLEMIRKAKDDEIKQLKLAIIRLEKRLKYE